MEFEKCKNTVPEAPAPSPKPGRGILTEQNLAGANLTVWDGLRHLAEYIYNSSGSQDWDDHLYTASGPAAAILDVAEKDLVRSVKALLMVANKNQGHVPAPAPRNDPKWSLWEDEAEATWDVGDHRNVIRLTWRDARTSALFSSSEARRLGNILVAEINWSAIGAVDVDTTREFAEKLQVAVNLTKIGMLKYRLEYVANNKNMVKIFIAPTRLIVEEYWNTRYPDLPISGLLQIGDIIKVNLHPPAPAPLPKCSGETSKNA